MANSEYKFPDEQENDAMQQKTGPEGADDALDIEVVDDTPPKDRGYPKAENVEDATDEELAQYTEGVQRRLKSLTHARHDERRAKEAALREREELARVAERLVEENKKLKQYVSSGEKVYGETLKSAAEAEVEMAKKRFKDAHEAFDADAILEAQSALLKAQLKLERAESFRPTPLQAGTEGVEHTESAPAIPRPDEKTLRWQARNQWFGNDDEMTAVALVTHKQLVNSGVDPRSDEYFTQIDARMHKRFPDFFSSGQGDEQENEAPAGKKKAATVVAPASRSTGAKKVKLTTTQLAIAKRLGVPLELYAKQLAAQEVSNG